jgi:anti-anti-sigma regulatory factor
VIALSTENSREIAVELAQLGVTAALIKPFQQDTFDREVQKVLGAPGAPHDAAGLESLLQDCLGEDDGCTVFAVPASAVTAKILPLLAARLRGLAKGGADRLILDLTQLSDIGGDQVTSLARVLAEAGSLGIRTALCAASEPLRTKLEQIAETKDAPCTATREAARASLR